VFQGAAKYDTTLTKINYNCSKVLKQLMQAATHIIHGYLCPYRKTAFEQAIKKARVFRLSPCDEY
jgi:hypothetical protein